MAFLIPSQRLDGVELFGFSGRAWRSRNGLCPSMRNIPAATQRFDQLDARRHLLHPEIHRRTLIAQQSGLRGDHIEVTVQAGFVAVVGERQVAL